MKDTEKIKDLNADARPYEKCMHYGPEYLTDAELLAVIIRTGTKQQHCVALAEQVLNNCEECKGLLGIRHLSLQQLMRIKGIGMVKAIQIQCVGELSRRISKSSLGQREIFDCPQTIAEYFMEDLRHREIETLMALFLNTRHMLIKSTELTKGTVNASMMSSRELFVEALKCNAVYVALLHNHPSGDPSPSKEDILNTRCVWEAGRIVGIELIDHIIIGDNKYISLKEQGIIH